ncbi:MAG: outer membrane beta-barrel protein, partial [Gammaproteobacteria bacterium]|nr:outer membrane beta-barrel protein [Gammaproteobacteria bacterium]
TVEATTIVDAAGIQATKFRLGVQHELLRNLIISLAWTTGQEDYRGIDRKDDNDMTAFESRYLMNRRVELVLGYTHRRRDTTPDTIDGFAFSRDVYRATVEVHL